MGLSINTNISALQAGQQSKKTAGLLSKTLQQLASAKRINGADDDAAGLAIAERFNSLALQGQVESRNLQSGISYAQTADGGLQAQQDAVQRIRELAVQAGNGTLNDDQRAALNQEAQQLIEQVNSVAETTEFNGTAVIATDQNVDLGTEGSAQINVNGSTATDLGIDTVDISTAAGAANALNALDSASNNISQNRAGLGAQINRFSSAINQSDIQTQNALAAESAIRDADIAKTVTELNKNRILLEASTAQVTQSNLVPQSVLKLLG